MVSIVQSPRAAHVRAVQEMAVPQADAEPAAELLQRRWFAAAAAVKSVDAECEVLLEVLELSREAWRVARARLANLEALRDTLGEQLAAGENGRGRAVVREPGVLSLF